MTEAILWGVLGLLGFASYKIISAIWFKFRLISCLAEDVYKQKPVGVSVFVFSALCWFMAVIFLWMPPVCAILILINAYIFRCVIMRSSPEVGFKIMRYSIAIGLTLVFSLVGIIAFAIALVMNRDSQLQERMRLLRQLQLENSMGMINR